MEELRIRVVLEDGSEVSLNELVANARRSGQRAGDAIEDGIADGVSRGVDEGRQRAEQRARIVGTAIGTVLGQGILLGIRAISFAVRGAFNSIEKSIDLSGIQEDAENAVNNALQATGRFSEQASQDIRDFASSLQQSSRFGDEVILNNAALIQSLGNLSTNGLQKATQAAADLAAGLQIDLRTASTLVGRAAAGEVGTFSRYGIAIETAATSSQTFANALDAINSRFGGRAAADVQTYSGAVDQLKNNYGDLLEVFGDFITGSNTIRNVISTIAQLINEFTTNLQGISNQGDFLQPIVLRFLDFVDFLNEVVIPTLTKVFEIPGQLATIAVGGIQTVASGFVSFVGEIAGTAGQLLNLVGADGIGSQLTNFAANAAAAFEENREALSMATADLFTIDEGAAIESVARSTEALRNALLTQTEAAADGGGGGLSIPVSFGDAESTPEKTVKKETEKLREALAIIQEDPENILEIQTSLGLADVEQGIFDKILTSEQVNVLKSRLREVQNGVRSFGQFVRAGATRIAIDWNRLAVTGITQGLQTIGAALIQGQNPWKAFLGTILSIIGDLALKLGAAAIATGIGVEAIGKSVLALTGGPAIAAGLALTLLGGALKAFAGQFGGQTSGGGGGASSFAAGVGQIPNEPLDVGSPSTGLTNGGINQLNDEEDAPQRQANVEVVIEGSAIGLTGEELGLEIVKVLEEAQFAGVELS